MAIQAEQVEQHVCSYCESLPTTTPWSRSGKVSHCPLCHGEILMTGGGATYRIYAEPEQVVLHQQRHPWRWALLGSVIALVVAGAIWFIVQSRAENTARSSLPQPAIMAPPSGAILAKPATTPLMASAKPSLIVPQMESKPERAPERIIEIIPERSAARTSAPSDELEMVQAKPWRTLPRPLVTQALPTASLSWRTQNMPAHSLMDLATAPELLLDATPAALDKDETTKHLQTLSIRIQKYNEAKPDGYVRHLQETRGDLAGLPFIMGDDCRMSNEQAKATAGSARVVRALFSWPRKVSGRSHSSLPESPIKDKAGAFWNAWRSLGESSMKKYYSDAAGMDKAWPAFAQILAPEAPEYRLGLVSELGKINSPEVSKHLAKLAVFEVDNAVRRAALEQLNERPKAEYTDCLLDALRHPWPLAAFQAAQAVVYLKRSELVPELINRLEQPDPRLPFEKPGAKNGLAVREMVRVNHAKNCFLCHAPSLDSKELLRGLVPSPHNTLPSSVSTAYYDRPGSIVVRADVIYLRQDFSAMMNVEKANPWPNQQRFDFLVRTRDLTEEEAAQWRSRQAAGNTAAPGEHHAAIHYALTKLTDLDLPLDATLWRRAKFTPTTEPTMRRSFSPCEK